MRRILLWSLLGLLVLVISLVSIVNVQVADVDALPAPDPALPIALGDGSELPLAEVLDRARRGLPLPLPEPQPEPLLPPELQASMASLKADLEALPRVDGAPSAQDDDPLFVLAEQSRVDGKLDQALALYLSIPPESEHYARARRIVAWNILARDKHQPAQAVRYANDALHADPFDGNVWQDWYRVHARTLGFPVD